MLGYIIKKGKYGSHHKKRDKDREYIKEEGRGRAILAKGLEEP